MQSIFPLTAVERSGMEHVSCLGPERQPVLPGLAKGPRVENPQAQGLAFLADASLRLGRRGPCVTLGHGKATCTLGKVTAALVKFGLALMPLHPNFWISEKPYENQGPSFAYKMRFSFFMNQMGQRKTPIQSFEASTKFHEVY